MISNVKLGAGSSGIALSQPWRELLSPCGASLDERKRRRRKANLAVVRPWKSDRRLAGTNRRIATRVAPPLAVVTKPACKGTAYSSF